MYRIGAIVPEANAMMEIIDAKGIRNLMFSKHFVSLDFQELYKNKEFRMNLIYENASLKEVLMFLQIYVSKLIPV